MNPVTVALKQTPVSPIYSIQCHSGIPTCGLAAAQWGPPTDHRREANTLPTAGGAEPCMSAAEPAVPTPPMNTAGPGAVIDITKRRRRGALQAAQGRWTTMATPPGAGHGPGDRTELKEFADHIEVAFNAVNQSLTNPGTATAFLTTVDVVEQILKGSHANGHLDDEQLGKLTAALDGMREAPRHV